MSNSWHSPSFPADNNVNYNIGTNEHGDFVRVPARPHQEVNPNIGTNEHGDFVRVPARPHQELHPNIGLNEHGDFVRVPEEPNRGRVNPQDTSNKISIFIHGFPDPKTESKLQTFEVTASYTVELLMEMIQGKLRIAKDQQRLVYAGEDLDRKKTLSDYNIQNGASIKLIVRNRGG